MTGNTLFWISLGASFAYVVVISVLIAKAIAVATQFHAQSRKR